MFPVVEEVEVLVELPVELEVLDDAVLFKESLVALDDVVPLVEDTAVVKLEVEELVEEALESLLIVPVEPKVEVAVVADVVVAEVVDPEVLVVLVVVWVQLIE